MDIDYFLKMKCEEKTIEGVLRTEEVYKGITNVLYKGKCV